LREIDHIDDAGDVEMDEGRGAVEWIDLA